MPRFRMDTGLTLIYVSIKASRHDVYIVWLLVSLFVDSVYNHLTYLVSMVIPLYV